MCPPPPLQFFTLKKGGVLAVTYSIHIILVVTFRIMHYLHMNLVWNIISHIYKPCWIYLSVIVKLVWASLEVKMVQLK